MSGQESWPTQHPSSEQQPQAQPSPTTSSSAQATSQQQARSRPASYQPSTQQTVPVLPPPSAISPTAAQSAYYLNQQLPVSLPTIPNAPHKAYPLTQMPPAQAIHPSHPAAATSEAPPPQGAIPAPAASHTTMAQSIIPPGPIQPAAPVQPPLGQQNSPLLAQPAVVPPNSASVVSAHHSLAALAQPNMNQQGAAQKQGSAQSGQQQQPAQNGPVGPILNDALSYLDQVKYQFADRPDVYNKFLDIMKDFKSQSIDTPGVIRRVSQLFQGHPNLVQGFNTFLPPGYIIQCSSDPADTSIRVTTPQGTTTNTSGAPVRATNPPRDVQVLHNMAGSRFYDLPQGQKAWPGAAEGMYGTYATPTGAPEPQRGSLLHEARAREQEIQRQEQQRASMAHQQAVAAVNAHAGPGQHPGNFSGVNQLQSAAAVTNGTARVNGTNGPSGSGVNGPDRQPTKGPVEFNHAISYVNKIKNRFATQPEIYKNFLEILQTYQREAKPIQDVYAQVTELFKSAPDLLEEFKQFLPESAAQARAAAAAKAAAEEAAAANAASVAGTAAMGGPARQPILGSFPPPPIASKENKKKRGQANGEPAGRDIQTQGQVRPAAAAKRSKLHHSGKATQEPAPISPTLAPYTPEPVSQPARQIAQPDELAFFDRVKKFIGNKQTYNEFLKLLNLFTQELIEKETLVYKVENFIGGNKELMEWFRRFVGVEGKDEVVDNIPAGLNKVRLSVCRSYGPSYRLLPKIESQKPCSGRDEMCRQVLNDEWASHPTWASEDSGFVAHRKNQYEDVLHRIEEERHDYDFNIEANLRTIQLLEPIAQKIAIMSPEEKANFKLGAGLDGQSKTIYKRVIKKIYDKDRGNEVIDQLHSNPCVVVPIVLKRLKQKDEEWKLAQREWNKVWREQTSKAFWKSLDHHGISVKNTDRKTYAMKTLISEITTKHQEQAGRRLNPATPIPDYQFLYPVHDVQVLLDATRILTIALGHSSANSGPDKDKMDGFLRSFIPLFFGFPQRELDEKLRTAPGRGNNDDDTDDAATDVSSHSHIRHHFSVKENLLKDVLKRKTSTRGGSRRVSRTTSRETSPGVSITQDEDVHMEGSETDPNSGIKTWVRAPGAHTAGMKPGDAPRPVNANLPVKRTTFTLFCNNQIYAFIRSFYILYNRLLDIKNCEAQAARDIYNRKHGSVAKELGIVISSPEDFFRDTGPEANYYKQVVEMCESFILGDLDSQTFEDGLRQVYIQKGWQLYTIDKLAAAVLKYVHTIVNSEKMGEAILLFQRDRHRKEYVPETSEYMYVIDYRAKVDRLFEGEEHMFKVEWSDESKDLTIQLLTKHDSSISSTLTNSEKWNHYIQSYVMTQPTEGVRLDTLKCPFLKRNIPKYTPTPIPSHRETPMGTPPPPGSPVSITGSNTGLFGLAPLTSLDGAGAVAISNLEVKICVFTYKIFYGKDSYDFFSRPFKALTPVPKEVSESRKKRWHDKVLGGQSWVKALGEEGVKERTEKWRKWATEGGVLDLEDKPVDEDTQQQQQQQEQPQEQPQEQQPPQQAPPAPQPHPPQPEQQPAVPQPEVQPPQMEAPQQATPQQEPEQDVEMSG